MEKALIIWAGCHLIFTGNTWREVLQQELNAERPTVKPRSRRLGPWEAVPNDLSDFNGFQPQETSPVLAYLLKECWGLELPATLRRVKTSDRSKRTRGDIMTVLSVSLIGDVYRGCNLVCSGYFLTAKGVPEYCVQDYELSYGYQALEVRTLADEWVPVGLTDGFKGPLDLPTMLVPKYEKAFPV